MFDEETETELHKLYSDQRRQIRELELERDALTKENMLLKEAYLKLREGLADLVDNLYNLLTEELFNTELGSKAEKHMINVFRDVQELYRL